MLKRDTMECFSLQPSIWNHTDIILRWQGLRNWYRECYGLTSFANRFLRHIELLWMVNAFIFRILNMKWKSEQHTHEAVLEDTSVISCACMSIYSIIKSSIGVSVHYRLLPPISTIFHWYHAIAPSKQNPVSMSEQPEANIVEKILKS